MDTTQNTKNALQMLFQIPELALTIFDHMPVLDLLVATQVCKDWQDQILRSTPLRNRLVHGTQLRPGTLPYQYAARIKHGERAFGRALPTNEAEIKRDYFFSVRQTALVQGEWQEGTLLIFCCDGIHVKLPIWNDPNFQLPRSVRAHLFADEILRWGPCDRMHGCNRVHLPHLYLNQMVSGRILEHRHYFDKHFGKMLQEDVCDDEYCSGEAIEKERREDEFAPVDFSLPRSRFWFVCSK